MSSPATTPSDLKNTSSVHDTNPGSKPAFGSRFLTDESQVWTQNAWDHVPPPEDQAEIIDASLARQKRDAVPPDEHHKYNDKPARHWDNFYKANSDNFFRNRKWLHNEFPELVAALQPSAGPQVIAELGCGAGNAVFPLLSSNSNPSLSLLAFDYSSHAVKLVQQSPLYISPPIGSIRASVWDLTSRGDNSLPPGVEESSVDIVVLVFVLSALHPDEWNTAVRNIHRMLKPNGLILLRDYGRHDLTQLRFKSNRLLQDNFYIRGDKTRVYFFELDELALLFTGNPAPTSSISITTETQITEDIDDNPDALSSPEAPAPPPTPTPPPSSPQIHPSLQPLLSSPSLFSSIQLGIDRRLLVNRKRQLKMYRVWMQAKFRKNGSAPDSSPAPAPASSTTNSDGGRSLDADAEA